MEEKGQKEKGHERKELIDEYAPGMRAYKLAILTDNWIVGKASLFLNNIDFEEMPV